MAKESGTRPAGEGPPTSIIIPVRDGLEQTRTCLESLLEHAGGRCEVLVVDRGSTDGTPGYLESAPVAHVRAEGCRGHAAALNAGLERATGEYVCMLSSDVVSSGPWLRQLQKHLKRNPRTAVAGPLQLDGDGRILHAGTVFAQAGQPSGPHEPLPVFQSFPRNDPVANVARSFPAMDFGCALVRRGLFERLGPLNEEDTSPGAYYAGIDWCFRARKAGFECRLVPGSRVMRAVGPGADAAPGDARILEKWEAEPGEFFTPPNIRLLLEGQARGTRKVAARSREERALLIDETLWLLGDVGLAREGASPLISQAAVGPALTKLQELINNLEGELAEPAAGRRLAVTGLTGGAQEPAGALIGKLRRVTAVLDELGLADVAVPFSALLALLFPNDADIIADRAGLVSRHPDIIPEPDTATGFAVT